MVYLVVSYEYFCVVKGVSMELYSSCASMKVNLRIYLYNNTVC